MAVIDFHVHIQKTGIHEGGKPEFFDKEILLDSMNKAGIDYSVLIVVARQGDMVFTKNLNDQLAALCDKEKRFFGFGSVNPYDGVRAVLDEMERCVKDLGLKGFKFHPFEQGFDVSQSHVVSIFRKAGELDVPVLIDSYDPSDATQSTKFLHLAVSCPDTKICFAHTGLFRFMDFAVFGFIKADKTYKTDVYFDLSSAISVFFNSPFQDQFRFVTQNLGSDRLLFGSNYPVYSQRKTLEHVKGFGYPKDWVPKILGENAAKLLKL